MQEQKNNNKLNRNKNKIILQNSSRVNAMYIIIINSTSQVLEYKIKTK